MHRKENDVISAVTRRFLACKAMCNAYGFLRHGFHGTRPLPNEANAHLDDAERSHESVSSHQPKATETQGNENREIRVIRA